MSMPNTLRIPIRIILFPVRLVISIFTGIMNFILRSAVVNKIFGLASTAFLIIFLLTTWSAIFHSAHVSLAARIIIPCLPLLASYITSPFSGAPKYLRLLTERIEGLNKRLKEI